VWPGSVQLLGHVDPDQRPKGKIACLDGHELVNSSAVYAAWTSSSAADSANPDLCQSPLEAAAILATADLLAFLTPSLPWCI
jgi:hypothetical protein